MSAKPTDASFLSIRLDQPPIEILSNHQHDMCKTCADPYNTDDLIRKLTKSILDSNDPDEECLNVVRMLIDNVLSERKKKNG